MFPSRDTISPEPTWWGERNTMFKLPLPVHMGDGDFLLPHCTTILVRLTGDYGWKILFKKESPQKTYR
jgi:hypothetical protein